MLYKEWLEIWLNNYIRTSCKQKTYVMYKQIATQRVIPSLGDRNLEKITPQAIQQFVTELMIPKEGCKPLSVNTINLTISVIQSSLKTAFILGYIKSYEANKISRPKIVEKKVECFSVLEQKRIENEVMKSEKIKLYGIVICMYTGLRLGELLALRWDNVDMANCQLSVENTCYYVHGERVIDTPKTSNSIRTIPFPKQLLPLFKALYKSRKTPFVIEANGKPLSIRSYQRSFELLLNKIHVQHKGFHSLRHTFATRALECGMDVKTLSELLGHKNPNITLKRYAHSMLEYKVQMMNKLGKMFA